MSCILLSVVRLGMPAGTEHGPGPLLVIGVGVEMASTVLANLTTVGAVCPLLLETLKQ